MAAFELFAVKESRRALDEFGETLKALWEGDVVGEEEIEKWHSTENTLQLTIPSFFTVDDAETIRRSSAEFIFWLSQGE